MRVALVAEAEYFWVQPTKAQRYGFLSLSLSVLARMQLVHHTLLYLVVMSASLHAPQENCSLALVSLSTREVDIFVSSVSSFPSDSQITANRASRGMRGPRGPPRASG
jgi:hypothetical protein